MRNRIAGLIMAFAMLGTVGATAACSQQPVPQCQDEDCYEDEDDD